MSLRLPWATELDCLKIIQRDWEYSPVAEHLPNVCEAQLKQAKPLKCGGMRCTGPTPGICGLFLNKAVSPLDLCLCEWHRLSSSIMSSAFTVAGSAYCLQRQLKSRVSDGSEVWQHTCLWSQHYRVWGRSVAVSSRPVWTTPRVPVTPEATRSQPNKKTLLVGPVEHLGQGATLPRDSDSSDAAPAPSLTVSSTQLISEWKYRFKNFMGNLWPHPQQSKCFHVEFN